MFFSSFRKSSSAPLFSSSLACRKSRFPLHCATSYSLYFPIASSCAISSKRCNIRFPSMLPSASTSIFTNDDSKSYTCETSIPPSNIVSALTTFHNRLTGLVSYILLSCANFSLVSNFDSLISVKRLIYSLCVIYHYTPHFAQASFCQFFYSSASIRILFSGGSYDICLT